MDKYDIQYAERTMRHIRRVQDHMLYLIAHHSTDMELTENDEWGMFQNAMKHDISKWKTEQFKPYCDKFTRKVDSPEFDAAWRDHYMTENHHYKSGRWIGKLELIETCCDLQAMADEFGEGSAFGFWDTKWRPELHEWLNINDGDAKDTELRRQMADEYQWHSSMLMMQQVIGWLNERNHEGPNAGIDVPERSGGNVR